MTLFEFILVMVSLVLAIGVTHLLQGIVTVVRHRETIAVEWVRLVWAASLFPTSVVYWWSLWDFRLAPWTYGGFFFVLLAPTSLFTAISLLFSPETTSSATTRYAPFEDVRPLFMVVMFAYSVVWSADGWVLGVEPAWNALRVPQMVLTVLLLVGTVSSRKIAQAVAVIWLLANVFNGFGPRFNPGAFGPP